MDNKNWLTIHKTPGLKKKFNEKKDRPEITDSSEIEQIIASAWGAFNRFIFNKFKKNTIKDKIFFIEFKPMLETLDLVTLSPEIAQKIMDDIVLSAPGIIKIDTGYMVSDLDLLYKNFGHGAIKRRILQIFTDNPDKKYSYNELSKALNVTGTKARNLVQELVLEGKVISTEKKENKSGTQYIIRQYKLK